MSVLSVDLGTSNTVAVLSAHDRPPRVINVDGAAMMPSAVYAMEDGQLIAGREAERRARLDPSRFEPNPKRRIDDGSLLLGDAVVPVTEALAAVLRKVSEESVRQLGGQQPQEVRLTHPAQWGPVRRNTLLTAARQANLSKNVMLVPEPVAAAAHYASFDDKPIPAGQALAVYDLGAGTFDVAIVGGSKDGFTVLAEAGLPDLGGLDIDQALLEHVGGLVRARDPEAWGRLLRPQSTADRRLARALREDIKASKESLSNHPQTDVALPDPFGDVLVTRAELEQLIRASLVRSTELLAATVRSAGMDPLRLAGVYLVGGSSRIPLVATLINEGLRILPTSLDQPETAVALGAHHVGNDGISLRTRDISDVAPPSDQSRTTAITPPRRQAPTAQHGPIPRQGHRPPLGTGPQPVAPMPVAYPSGPMPVSQPGLGYPPHGYQQPAYPPVYPQSGYPQQAMSPPKGSAVAAGVLALVMGALLFFASLAVLLSSFAASQSNLDEEDLTGLLLVVGLVVAASAVTLIVSGVRLVTFKGGQVGGAIAFGLYGLVGLVGLGAQAGIGGGLFPLIFAVAGFVLCVLPSTSAVIRFTRQRRRY
ncbi:MAG: Hsp70 family protein [Actinomycetota bacterium]|nr:Hsp70 family protein [Actinomycetota bacterium]